ncbi:DUF2721 domain-containing protein [Methylobacterium sp. J-001]|uniref:DUF2721 domain-containing protein n=1 Tax=Methylobacterium sp. J-001 TaxID=2836609 RepID=UPI001FB8DE5E|nr:DUF2721 domain-containing protein [Methylobacterium sp. J-001]MCJ2116575.1 DUF2721 domain-containing protein [Methylobacterium sp. J-001]
MNLDLANILKVIGPAASIIFAAWIFMGFLQVRYDSAIDRYRELIEKYRTSELSESRKANMRDQIFRYKRRCELMGYANIIGLTSAILLIITLIAGGLSLAFPDDNVFKYVSLSLALIGLSLVIVATAIVMREGVITNRQIYNELLDIPDLAEGVGREAGDISDPHRRSNPT